jgi:bacterial/archaeal transporter family-2 protein
VQALFYALAALAGLSNPVQSAANATLNKGVGQPIFAGLVIYAVGVVGLLLLAAGAAAFGLPFRGPAGKLGGIPWWAFVGGLCNVTFALCAAISTQKIGSAAYTVTVLVVAVLLSLVLDQFGLMGLKEHPLSWARGIGAALAVAGVVLISLF